MVETVGYAISIQKLKAAFLTFQRESLSTWAAALTYYSILATFPALIVLVSLVGLFGDATQVTDSLLRLFGALGPNSSGNAFSSAIKEITRNRNTAGAFFAFGLVISLVSASSYVSAFAQASHAIYGTEDKRSFLRLKPLQVFTTFALIVLLIAVFLTLIFTNEMFRAVTDAFRLGHTVTNIITTAKFFVSFGLLLVVISSLYAAATNMKRHELKTLAPGAMLAVLSWLLISLLFRFYITHFSTYSKTYGAMAGFVILLIWFWLSNAAILLGAALNAELAKKRAFEKS